MSPAVTLTFSGDQHTHLERFLFPGDGKEAAAILLCGRRAGDLRHRLVVRGVYEIPYGACTARTPTLVTWPTDAIEALLERATREELSVIKVHSHPTGYPAFSATDDLGDARLLPMIRGWVEADILHGSAVMLPGGEMFGRVLGSDGNLRPISTINVVGDDLHYWHAEADKSDIPEFTASHAQAFDEGTIRMLRRLVIGVVGCSGTGSPIIEQLMRLGVGIIILIDDDKMEERNINRIQNSTMQDVRDGRFKVDVQGDAIERAELGTRVIRVPKNLWDPEAIHILGQCDGVFGCMDTVDGRFLLNTLATCYNIAYFDIGVRLDAVRSGPGKGDIREICGAVHYLQPGRSSLMSRGVFTMKQVAAAGLQRTDPQAHGRQVKDGYIAGVQNHRPAVISVNMFASALAVNDFLARLHPYREEPNSECASITFSLASTELIPDPESESCALLNSKVGIGDTTPLLGLMALAERRAA